MATYFRLVDVGRQFFDDNGDPLAGGKLYAFEAGTTTPKAIYEDNAGVTAHTNPIVLDAAGRATAEVWGTTGSYKLKLDDSTDSNIWTRDNISGVNDVAAGGASEWIAYDSTATRLGATSFSLEGDQTTVFHAGRRLKVADSGGTDYATIVSSVFSSVTTVTVAVDGTGSLAAGALAVSYGIVAAANSSSPAANGWSLVDSRAVTAVTAIDFEGGFVDGWDHYFTFSGVYPDSTDGMRIRVKESGAYISSAASYRSQQITSTNTTTASAPDATLTSGITGTASNAAAAAEAMTGTVWFPNPASASLQTRYMCEMYFGTGTAATATVLAKAAGEREAAAACEGVRFFWTGNDFSAAGFIKHYRRKSA